MKTEQQTGHDLLKSLTAPEFLEYYKKNIEPVIGLIETHRIRCLAALGSVFAVCAAALIILISLNGADFFKYMLPLVVVPAILIITLCEILIKKYRMKSKELFMQKLLNYFGNFKHSVTQSKISLLSKIFNGKKNQKKSKYTLNSLNQLKMFSNTFNKFSLDDNIQGVYRDMNIEIQEMELKYTRGKRNEIIFKGLLMSVDLKKRIKKRTVVIPEYYNYAHTKTREGLERVILEDPIFEGNFQVFSQDQIEARYVLTTGFMEKMLKATQYCGGLAACEFVGGKAFIAFPANKDWFEIPLFKPVNKFQSYQKILCDFTILLSFVDVLNLDSNTGL